MVETTPSLDDKRRRRIRILSRAAAILTVIGFGPVLAALASAATANLLGCRLNGAAANPCIALGRDIGGLLQTGFTAGWLFFLTIPLAMVAAVLWIAVGVLWIGGRREPFVDHGAASTTPPEPTILTERRGPIELDVHDRKELRYYPGEPTGYSAYTDHTAMNCTLNDDLVGRLPPLQFDLVGFAVGLLDGVMQRVTDRDDVPAVLHFETTNYLQDQYIGWLAVMQERGTDNAAPSTRNLHGAVHSLALHICKDGPVTRRFWDQANEASQSETQSPLHPEDMRLFLTIFERSRRLGLAQGQNARIEEG